MHGGPLSFQADVVWVRAVPGPRLSTGPVGKKTASLQTPPRLHLRSRARLAESPALCSAFVAPAHFAYMMEDLLLPKLGLDAVLLPRAAQALKVTSFTQVPHLHCLYPGIDGRGLSSSMK